MRNQHNMKQYIRNVIFFPLDLLISTILSEEYLKIVPDLFFLTSSFKLSLGYPNLLSETIQLPFLVARLLCKFSLKNKVEYFTLNYFGFCYPLK